MRIRKEAPRLMLIGITSRLLLPVIILAQCGIKSPTQPTCPHMETEEAVIMVIASTRRIRILFRWMPLALASSSLRERMLNCQRSR